MSKVTTQDLTADDLYLFAEGTHGRLASKLGAHVRPDGTSFAVWAPNAERVSVIGDFNGWDPGSAPLEPVASSGIWSGRIEGAHEGQTYKFHIRSRHAGYRVDKADPFAFRAETPPKTGSIVWDSHLRLGRHRVARRRARSANGLSAPMSIYEVHLGSWRRGPGKAGSATATSRRSSPTTHSTSASPTSNCCRSWSIRSTARGATRRRDTSRRRAGSARRRT